MGLKSLLFVLAPAVVLADFHIYSGGRNSVDGQGTWDAWLTAQPASCDDIGNSIAMTQGGFACDGCFVPPDEVGGLGDPEQWVITRFEIADQGNGENPSTSDGGPDGYMTLYDTGDGINFDMVTSNSATNEELNHGPVCQRIKGDEADDHVCLDLFGGASLTRIFFCVSLTTGLQCKHSDINPVHTDCLGHLR
ncbi:hypothetical protein FH972_024453 [Carpinus fangiana]|uniref:Expansin-like EG45 domain-containing protein n=1 Tax=Carpinus fangiana TaxID=176857 RepID=A0A5N6KYZ5_9ROSI|nr:hypothetical protein FH972_024453 [Carpinus fangiana]